MALSPYLRFLLQHTKIHPGAIFEVIQFSHTLVDHALMNCQSFILSVLGRSNPGESFQHHLWIPDRSFPISYILGYLKVFPFIPSYKNLGKSSFCDTFSLFKLPQVMSSMTFDVMNGKTSPNIRSWKN